MSGDVVIRAAGLGKKYVIGHEAGRQGYTALRDIIGRQTKAILRTTSDMLRGRPIVAGDTTEEFWALKDVNFEIKRGEVVGIIGRNGAGKSTLLKVLSRISEPTTGRVEIRGRVTSLLEVGTGFHSELSGRENIFLNGAILGMARAEIRRKFDEIVAFSGIEKFLDTPVKRYSSGMYMRLAFSVAAYLESEILVVDEVLAVGDTEFQRKCLGKMNEVVSHGRTVIFVSHNLSAIRTLCPRSICLASGQIIFDADSESVITSYLAQSKLLLKNGFQTERKLEGGLHFRGTRITPEEICTWDSARFEFSFEAQKAGTIRECVVCLFVQGGAFAGTLDVGQSVDMPIDFQPGNFTLTAEIDSLPLVDRDYVVALYLITDEYVGTFDAAHITIDRPLGWTTTTAADARGVVNFKGRCSLSKRPAGTLE